MKIAAGIAGILLGIFSLTYVGIFGSMIGSAAGLLGSIPFRGNTLGPWAEMVSMLSWLAPLATIVGGIVTFSNPRVGGIILGVSAFLHWYLLGFGQVGKLFVLPIGATAALALFASSSTRPATNLEAAQTSAVPPNLSNTAGPSFDRAKWNALVQYDKDISAVAQRLSPLGQKWLDEFASSYLALNDKQYLPEIERKILLAAKAEAEENQRLKEQAAEQHRLYLQEHERAAEIRRQQVALWRDRLWGNQKRRALSLGCIGLLVAAVIGGITAHKLQQKRDMERAENTVLNFLHAAASGKSKDVAVLMSAALQAEPKVRGFVQDIKDYGLESAAIQKKDVSGANVRVQALVQLRGGSPMIISFDLRRADDGAWQLQSTSGLPY